MNRVSRNIRLFHSEIPIGRAIYHRRASESMESPREYLIAFRPRERAAESPVSYNFRGAPQTWGFGVIRRDLRDNRRASLLLNSHQTSSAKLNSLGWLNGDVAGSSGRDLCAKTRAFEPRFSTFSFGAPLMSLFMNRGQDYLDSRDGEFSDSSSLEKGR